MKKRIDYLDGHRGVAILLVMLFHAYSQWSAIVPYGADFKDVAIFKFGWLGVELFFLISGFVILMTLEKCATPREFLLRRWIRLFPAMLLCTAIIFYTAGLFFERPAGRPDLESVLPGLTFVEPRWWSRFLGHPVKPLEGAFWSLFVEFKFYVFSAALYYFFGRRWLIISLAIAFLFSVVIGLLRPVYDVPLLNGLDNVNMALSFRFFGWFSAGASFYVYVSTGSRKWFGFACLMAVASSVAIRDFSLDLGSVLGAILVSLFFAISVINDEVKRILSTKLILFFGSISYPLYLLHENMMISAVIKLGPLVGEKMSGFLPVPVIGCLSILAFLISSRLEPLIRSMMISCVPWRSKAI